MDEKQRAGLDRLERAGYTPIIRDWAKACSVPFWWHDPDGAVGSAVVANGTMTFVKTGKRTLGVSALHVLAGFRDAVKGSGKPLVCQLGAITFQPDSRVVDESPRFDLVTFDMSDVIVSGARATAHEAPAWPPPQPADQQLVIAGGFPGNYRIEKEGSTSYAFLTYITRIKQSTDEHFALYLNTPEAHAPPGVPIVANPDLGGASGGPVFRISEAGLDTLRLVGVIYEASQAYELVFARPLNLVDAHGRIRP